MPAPPLLTGPWTLPGTLSAPESFARTPSVTHLPPASAASFCSALALLSLLAPSHLMDPHPCAWSSGPCLTPSAPRGRCTPGSEVAPFPPRGEPPPVPAAPAWCPARPFPACTPGFAPPVSVASSLHGPQQKGLVTALPHTGSQDLAGQGWHDGLSAGVGCVLTRGTAGGVTCT